MKERKRRPGKTDSEDKITTEIKLHTHKKKIMGNDKKEKKQDIRQRNEEFGKEQERSVAEPES